jgi:hypothetical protein
MMTIRPFRIIPVLLFMINLFMLLILQILVYLVQSMVDVQGANWNVFLGSKSTRDCVKKTESLRRKPKNLYAKSAYLQGVP